MGSKGGEVPITRSITRTRTPATAILYSLCFLTQKKNPLKTYFVWGRRFSLHSSEFTMAALPRLTGALRAFSSVSADDTRANDDDVRAELSLKRKQRSQVGY